MAVPAIPWPDAAMEAFANGGLVLTCPRLRLLAGGEEGARTVEGSGTISKGRDGRLKLSISAASSAALEDHYLSGAVTLGRSLRAEDYYALDAVDDHGCRWQARQIDPKVTFGIGTGRMTAETDLHECWSERPSAAGVGTFRGVGWTPGRLDLATPEFSEARLPGSGAESPAGCRRDTARIDCAGMHVVFQVRDEGVIFELTGATDVIPEGWDLRLCESLQFVSGREASWTALWTNDGSKETLWIRDQRRACPRNASLPPLSTSDPDRWRDNWRRFECYLKHIIGEPDGNRLHPLSAAIGGVVRYGDASAETQLLTTCVAVESVLGGYPDPVVDGPAFKKEFEDAKVAIRGSHMSDRMKDRLVGFIGSINSARAQDKLMTLCREGLVDEALVSAWKRGRNAAAHGTWPKDVGKTVKLLFSTRVLLNLLVFHAIGYQGQYTDYSTEGLPTRVFPPEPNRSAPA